MSARQQEALNLDESQGEDPNFIATAAAGLVDSSEQNQQQQQQGHSVVDEDEIKEQDRLLPIANVARIMKCALPSNAKISKEAKECIQECVSEFILFITSEASERCSLEKKKTIGGDELLAAMNDLGFDNYLAPLSIYLQRYRETHRSSQSRMSMYPAGQQQPNNFAQYYQQ